MANGEYAINNGDFTRVAGLVSVNDTVTVRLTSAATHSRTTSLALTVGTFTTEFGVTTLPDTTPNAFTFPALTDQALTAQVTSNTIQVTGIDVAAPIHITNGEYAINNGAFTSTPGHISVNDTLAVRLITQATFNTVTTAVLTIGTFITSFSATTLAADSMPAPPNLSFTFTASASQPQLSTLISNDFTVEGINQTVPITLTNGAL